MSHEQLERLFKWNISEREKFLFSKSKLEQCYCSKNCILKKDRIVSWPLACNILRVSTVRQCFDSHCKLSTSVHFSETQIFSTDKSIVTGNFFFLFFLCCKIPSEQENIPAGYLQKNDGAIMLHLITGNQNGQFKHVSRLQMFYVKN